MKIESQNPDLFKFIYYVKDLLLNFLIKINIKVLFVIILQSFYPFILKNKYK